MPKSVSTTISAAQTAIVPRFVNTAFKLVIIAVAKSTCRSTSIGTANALKANTIVAVT